MSANTGVKTIDRISEVPVISSTLSNVNDYYTRIKESNPLIRAYCSLAEIGFKTMALTAMPIVSLIQSPGNLHSLMLKLFLI